MRLSRLAHAAALLGVLQACPAWATEPTGAMQPSTVLQPPPRGAAGKQLPIVLRARSLSAQPDLAATAEGDVEFRLGGLVIRADTLSYDTPTDQANARGNVRVFRDGAIYTGTELQLRVQRSQGYFLQPRFEFPLLGAGGRADRLEFLDTTRMRAVDASYTSCPRDGPAPPDWELRTSRITVDLATNEGLAEGAVLRFLGLPILAWPSLSFPLSDDRKSGWLPPSLNIDNRSGVEVVVPYYWNIAPNRDMTLTPRVSTRRGLALDTEFRYLEPRDEGTLGLDWLPHDRTANRSRQALRWLHDGQTAGGLRYRMDLLRVSDDNWWKDFPNSNRGLTPRLLPLRAALEQPFRLAGGADGLAYARVHDWQVLQAADTPIASPYERSPQLGVRLGGRGAGWEYTAETEYNRFVLPAGEASRAGRTGGQRLHALASLSRPLRESGLWLVPRLSLNAASYRRDELAADGSRSASRVIPTLSVDAGLEFERPLRAFGRELLQTLEPRLLYVNTPFRSQSQLPNYDAAAKDFNFVSIFTDNAFSGVDRVADAHQVTAGVTSRLIDASTGIEAMRVGVVQRYLLRDQRVAPQADGSPDGPALTRRLSDVLLIGSTSVLPQWALDSALQYSPDSGRSVRTILSARYSPGPFRTVSTTYRLARGLSEQMELGWQWPIGGGASRSSSAAADARDDQAARGSTTGNGSCSGTWYAVGRVNYSLKDARVTDAVLGLEYDAGCWIGRIVAKRLSTGFSEATTRLLFELELVGLSRLGSNPLKVLKDNIPGYRLLRDERGTGQRTDEWQPAP